MCDNGSEQPASTNSLVVRKAGCMGASKPASVAASPSASFAFANGAPLGGTQVSPAALAEYQQRLQMYDYAAQAAMRFRLSQAALSNASSSGAFGGHPALAESGGGGAFGGLSPFSRYDPRFRFMHEEPKPQHSYIGLIAMAILSNPDQKMVLSDIYQHILDHYPYFRNRGPGWRNSIRHNLSLNDCFVKAGRSANGKGHYWAIHPANVEDFKKGDFRRRKAQRKVRKHMGLSVPDDEDSQSPGPTPRPFDGPGGMLHQPLCANLASLQEMCMPMVSALKTPAREDTFFPFYASRAIPARAPAGKRQFDMESLLAPDSTVAEKASSGERNLILDLHHPGRFLASGPMQAAEKPPPPPRRSASPLSAGSPKLELLGAGSNCSSPSVSSSGFISPQPTNSADNCNKMTSSEPHQNQAQHPAMSPLMANSGGFASQSAWHAQLQSLHNLHQINASLAHHHHQHQQHPSPQHLLRNTPNPSPSFNAWAAMSAFSNSQAAAAAAASLFGYPCVTMASPPRTLGGQK